LGNFIFFTYCVIVKFGVLYLIIKNSMEDNFNIHLGKKLRMRRLSLGLTQTKVAQAINVTFQQIQKYEKGTNGVSSNRLMQLSQFLKVPIIYFFEDFKDFKDINISQEPNDDLNYSFLSRTFTSLSRIQKEKILQILNNTIKFEKVG
jgi:transcriptional regulator with XRE-family HTH domain